MKKPNLFLFTSNFPFGNQETFLEAEIPILIKEFNLYIFPRKIEKDIRPGFEYLLPHVNTGLSDFFSKNKKFQKKYAYLNFSFITSLFSHFSFLTSIESIKRLLAFVAEFEQTKHFISTNKVLFLEGGVVYSYWLNGSAYALSKFFSNHNNIKVTSRAHRYDVYDDLYTPSFMPFRNQLLNLIDKVYCVSDNGRNYIINKYSQEEKVKTSRLGTLQFSNSQENFPVKNTIKIITISNIYPVKRLGLIAQYIIEYTKNSDYLIVWDHYGDGPERPKVDKILEEKPNNLSVNITRRVPNKQIHSILSQGNYDFLLNLSDSEGLPVTMMEAISYGIPVLATEVGGVNEIVTGNTGVLLSKDCTSKEFSNGVEKIILDFPKTEATQNNIAQFWGSNYSAINNYNEFAAHLKEILN